MCFKNTLRVCVAFCSCLCNVKVGSCITRLKTRPENTDPRVLGALSLSLRRFIALLISRQAYYSQPCSVCGRLVLEVTRRSKLTSELKVGSFSLQHKS